MLKTLSGLTFLFELDNKMTKFERQRYSFWAALGDIGGFYDGLNLLISIFMAPLSSAMFFNDLVKGSLFTKKSSESLRATGRQAASLFQGQAADENQTESVLLNFLEQLRKHHGTIRSSIVQSLMANVCPCRSRSHRARIKAQEPYASELDVKRLMSNSIGYRSFIRALLTPQQKVWLANQRSRVASLDSDNNSYSSENESPTK